MSKQPTPAQPPASVSPEEALVNFLNDVGNVHADRVNSHLKNRYASLAEILDTVKPVAAKHGFALFTPGWSADGLITVVTDLIHTSGKVFNAGRISIKAEGLNPQQIGSAITYVRRQSLQLACNISTEADDDANAASKPSGMPATASAPAKPATTLFPPKPGL
jgi:hypothetical protein